MLCPPAAARWIRRPIARLSAVSLVVVLTLTACTGVPEGYAANDLGVLCKVHPKHPESPELHWLVTQGTEEQVRDWYGQQKRYDLVDTSSGFGVRHPDFPDYYILTWERKRELVTACADIEL